MWVCPVCNAKNYSTLEGARITCKCKKAFSVDWLLKHGKRSNEPAPENPEPEISKGVKPKEKRSRVKGNQQEGTQAPLVSAGRPCLHRELHKNGECIACSTFVSTTSTPEHKILAFDFKPGERVEYCGDQAEVVINYGDSGMVKQGNDMMRWYWVFQGEPVRRVEE